MLATGSEGLGFIPSDGKSFSKGKKETIGYEQSGNGIA